MAMSYVTVYTLILACSLTTDTRVKSPGVPADARGKKKLYSALRHEN